MKPRLISALLFVVLAVPGVTEQNQQKEMDRLIASGAACEIFTLFAGQTMTPRQEGANVAEAVKIGGNIGGAFDTILDEFLLVAYESPRFATPKNIEVAVQDFQIDAFLQCKRASQ